VEAIAKGLAMSKPTTPKWSIGARTPQPEKPAWVPGPGTYKNPSTLLNTHPTLATSGRGWAFGNDGKNQVGRSKSFGSLVVNEWGPKYDVKHNQTEEKDPSWLMAERVPGSLRPRQCKDTWGVSVKPSDAESKHADPKDTIAGSVNVLGMHPKGGNYPVRACTILGRPQSTLVPRGSDNSPGPGKYHNTSIEAQSLQGTIHRGFSFGKASAFGRPRPKSVH
jgi:hypothetical protein